ncbi:MAG TPA: branched-chain amino acid ABC transporter permease [Bacillus sp. (in: firmicutes)]|uniref:branched-chain amino acid ABC transporter permease n=1 Tax=Bacillus litorisediminis TaxID=2922713 RepID=UPI001FAEF56B|nr:branched-chain amino acid ABC transporter permease [Bacillus litorisediminis]HWO75248.1 branched-chain amino acid ABC transporter permease [Bacillus sp. (in: firmicutes)]
MNQTGVQKVSWKGIGVFSLFILMLPFMFSSSFFITNATFAGIYTIVTVGLGLLMGFAGQISIGQAAFYGVGAYTSAVLTTTYGWSPWISLILSLVLPALIAYILGHTMARLHGYYLAMATLAFGIIIHVLLVEWKTVTKGASGFYGIPKLELFGFTFRQGLSYYFLVWVFALIVIILALNIIHSRIGRALRSIHDSEIAASSMGVDTGKYKMQIFILSASFAGLAGWLFAHMSYSIAPSSFSLDHSVLFLVMVVLGGSTSIWGPVFGAFLITAINLIVHSLGSHFTFITSDFEQVLYGLILVAVVMFMPKGFFPTVAPKLKGAFQKNRRKAHKFEAVGTEKGDQHG